MYNCNQEVLEALFKSLTEEQAFELMKLFKNVEFRSSIKGFMNATVVIGSLVIYCKVINYFDMKAKQKDTDEKEKMRS